MSARLLLIVSGLIAALPAWGADPAQGDWFRYGLERTITGTGGTYLGWSDKLLAAGRYEIGPVGSDLAEVQGAYFWKYTATSGEADGGSETRTIWVRLSDRRYDGARTDLDEYDGKDARALTTWLWIPTDPTVGSTLQILDETYLVADREDALYGRPAIRVEMQGTGTRNDDYGTFKTSYAETMWFDAATGYVLGTRYDETDFGRLEGEHAEFALTEEMWVVESSWAGRLEGAREAPISAEVPADGETPPSGTSGGTGDDRATSGVNAVFGTIWMFANCAIWAFVLAFIGIILWVLARTVVRGLVPPASLRTAQWGEVRFRPVTDTATLSLDDQCACTILAPFLEDMAKKALLADGRVVAAEADRKLVGIGLIETGYAIGTILTTDTQVALALQKHLRCEEFFAEVRYPAPSGKPAFNVAETYAILRVDPVPDPPYDADLVQRMKDEDVADVNRLALAVYGTPSDRWVRAQIESGDAAYVARVDGKIVGFGFAGLVGEAGRLHTGTVDAAFRGRGIGSELWRARLRALNLLGARTAMVEIADWNLASIHLAQKHGFSKVGEMTVQTSREYRGERVIYRR